MVDNEQIRLHLGKHEYFLLGVQKNLDLGNFEAYTHYIVGNA